MNELVAGIDIGNATTEVIVAEAGTPPVLIWHDVAPTRGAKGSPASLSQAGEMLEGIEKRLGRRCSRVGLCRLRPVASETVGVSIDHGSPLPIVELPTRAKAGGTVSGFGAAWGAASFVSELDEGPREGDRVAVVPGDVDFEVAAELINEAVEAGRRIVGAIAAGDDAVLIGNRLKSKVPVVDEVDIESIRPGELVAIEAGRDRHPLSLADPLALKGVFGDVCSLADYGRVVEHLGDRQAVALVCRPVPEVESGDGGAWIEVDDVRFALSSGEARRLIRSRPPGPGIRVMVPGHGLLSADDVFLIDFAELDEGMWVRRDTIAPDRFPLAVLLDREPDDFPELGRVFGGRRVTAGFDETRMAWLGSSSTPGFPESALVVDIGGGTIDLTTGTHSVTAAGGGNLVRSAVAAVLSIETSKAEIAMRGPAVRVESPWLQRDEAGVRTFLENPLTDEVGWLCRTEGGERVRISDRFSPEEWRGLRLTIKRDVFQANLRRAASVLPTAPTAVVLCGGGAVDSEILRAVGGALGLESRTPVAKADVLGRLGPRFAVAWGLVMALAAGEAP